MSRLTNTPNIFKAAGLHRYLLIPSYNTKVAAGFPQAPLMIILNVRSILRVVHYKPTGNVLRAGRGFLVRDGVPLGLARAAGDCFIK